MNSDANWRDADRKPAEAGVYAVRVLTLDHATGETRDVAVRYARWTGEHWCAWAPDPERAARCAWACGPLGGYRWRPAMAMEAA
jgi:hypothetical protein